MSGFVLPNYVRFSFHVVEVDDLEVDVLVLVQIDYFYALSAQLWLW